MGGRFISSRLRPWSQRASDIGLTLLAAATVFLVVAVVLDAPPTSPAAMVAEGRSVPSPDPAATRAAEPATPAPRPTPSVASASEPRAPGLRVTVITASAGGLRVRITVRVRDDDGSWNGGTVSFGDGTRQSWGRTTRCTSGTGATDATRTVTHTYPRPGSYSVLVLVRTDRLCSTASPETATQRVRVSVPRPGSAAPRPTTLPAPSRSAGPRPTTVPSRTAAPHPTSQPTSQPTSDPDASSEPTDEPSPDPTETHRR